MTNEFYGTRDNARESIRIDANNNRLKEAAYFSHLASQILYIVLRIYTYIVIDKNKLSAETLQISKTHIGNKYPILGVTIPPNKNYRKKIKKYIQYGNSTPILEFNHPYW